MTSFRQGDHSVDEWYNAVQNQINLARYPHETARILQRDIFWFFLKNEEFVSRTINDSNIDLDKFQASKVRQLAKKLGSSKSTAKHIKQVSSELQVKQVNLLRHQRTELPPSKSQRKQRKSFRSKQANHKYQQKDEQDERVPQAYRRFKQVHTSQEDRCSKCGDTLHIEGFKCPASRHQCKYCHKFAHFSYLCFKKKQEYGYKRSSRSPKAHQLMVEKYSTEGPLDNQADTSFTSSEDSFCLQMKVKHKQTEDNCSDVQHLVMYLEYKLKSHRRRTKFLRARIDTCSNVNVMPVSVYHMMYKDPDFAKLLPSKKTGIYTYITEKIPVIGSCELFIIHPDTKYFQAVTFQVVNTEGSVIVSCATSISLNLIQIHSALNVSVPDFGQLIYSCADDLERCKHKKMKSNVNICDNASAREVQPPKEPKVVKTEVAQ